MKYIILVVLLLAVLGLAVTTVNYLKEPSFPSDSVTDINKAMWEYQCVDTMKTSRDKARAWENRSDLVEHIDKEMTAIANMGANCVALDTPYDEEFLPYLKKWVDAAREHNLKIWFRGNFSAWEGWFEYPHNMTTAQHIARTNDFIRNNADLFEDGDIFTPSPEAENGGPFNQVEVDEHVAFRRYLIQEHTEAQQTFQEIGKDVKTNWLSMNGGLAKRMFDQNTIDSLGKVVSLDHYIADPKQMGEFIDYFVNNFETRVVIGEWGAPIPEINGDMSEDEQNEFIGQLLDEMYKHREHIDGVNYWVLFDSSTEIYNKDLTPRKAVETIADYFKPSEMTGSVFDKNGKPIEGAKIIVDNGSDEALTGSDGKYSFLLPAGVHDLAISADGFDKVNYQYKLQRNKSYSMNFILNSPQKSLLDNIRDIF